jgi:hypothetical protein
MSEALPCHNVKLIQREHGVDKPGAMETQSPGFSTTLLEAESGAISEECPPFLQVPLVYRGSLHSPAVPAGLNTGNGT